MNRHNPKKISSVEIDRDEDGFISVASLLDHVRTYNPKSDLDRISKAYSFAKTYHEHQKRRSGEKYFSHPIEVALILTGQRLDDATIITALLHDTLEDTRATYQDIEREFGKEIAKLVNGVTKLTNLELLSTESKQAENIRKLVFAMSEDIRVILVKLGDRLHNMRTISYMPKDKQVSKSRETMDIFAPLAGRMGMQWMREELEDLAFQVLNPEARNSILRRFVKLRQQTDDVIPKIKQDIQQLLVEAKIPAQVYGREKKPYSIWRKMEEKGESFSRLSDIYGFRIIPETEDECYRVLGKIHQKWSAVPGRFKDYISQPKSNGYRSIHTTISGREARRVEVQIRTLQMHDVAEVGIAAHWAYRDGTREENPFTIDPTGWLIELAEHLESGDHNEDSLEHMKLEMFSDQVFCFTPKGKVIKLPRGANALDFAYAVHSALGASCVGVKIDGMRQPLSTRLRNGQSVQIIRADGQTPQRSWLDIVKTGRAKSAIRRALRHESREKNMKLGEEIARNGFDQIGKKFTKKSITMAASTLRYETADDLLEALGLARVTAEDVVHAVYPESYSKDREGYAKTGGHILGLDRSQVPKVAQCCLPLPGERIVGITYRGHGVVVHAISCPHLADLEDQSTRWVDLAWTGGRSIQIFDACLHLMISNDAGVLGRVCTTLGEYEANISDLNFLDRKPDFYKIAIDIEVFELSHLNKIISVLEADENVSQVMRVGRKVKFEP